MPTVTIPKSVSRDDVAKALDGRLTSDLHVLPADRPDSFIVRRGPVAVTQARVRVQTGEGSTSVTVSPFGFLGLRLMNYLNVARPVASALKESGLGQ
jgi:hypothetical protein